MGSLEEIGGSAPATGTEPGLSVTGRADGEAYTVTSGARALVISNPDGAALSTTVELASDGSAVTVTDSTTTSPSWTAPSGGTDGDAVAVRVTATSGALSSSVSFAERVAGSGGPSWVTELSWDLEEADPVAEVTASGSNQTVNHVDSGVFDFDMNIKAYSSNAGTYEVTANGGEFAGGNAATSTTTLAYRLSEELASLGYEWLTRYPVALQILVKSWSYGAGTGGDGFYFGLNSTYTHNSGKFRGVYMYQDSVDPTVEKRFIRNTGSNTAIADGVANTVGQGRQFTVILSGGDFVEVAVDNDVSALSDPSTAFRTAAYLQCGSWGLSRDATSTVYTSDLRLILSAVQQAGMHVSAIRLMRWKAAP